MDPAYIHAKSITHSATRAKLGPQARWGRSSGPIRGRGVTSEERHSRCAGDLSAPPIDGPTQQPQAGHDLVPVQVRPLQVSRTHRVGCVGAAPVQQSPVIEGDDVTCGHGGEGQVRRWVTSNTQESWLAEEGDYSRKRNRPMG